MKTACVLLLGLLSFTAHAAEIGERLAPFTLDDQHDQRFTLDATTHVLLAASDMDGAKLVNAAVGEEPKGYLEQRHVAFVADIQRMPALIGKLFAIPKMRGYSYRVVLDREGQVVPHYAVTEGQVIWLQLDNTTVVNKRTFTSADALRKALAELPQK